MGILEAKRIERTFGQTSTILCFINDFFKIDLDTDIGFFVIVTSSSISISLLKKIKTVSLIWGMGMRNPAHNPSVGVAGTEPYK